MHKWVSSALMIGFLAFSTPLHSEPKPGDGSVTDPKGLQVEPVDFKTGDESGKTGSPKTSGKKQSSGKTDKTQKTDPKGLQVEPVDFKTTQEAQQK